MPIYEYECLNCTTKFEKIQKISDEPIKVCPECNLESVRKLISATRFRLKGQGWYETDFKSSSETKRNLVSSDDSQVKVNNVSSNGDTTTSTTKTSSTVTGS